MLILLVLALVALLVGAALAGAQRTWWATATALGLALWVMAGLLGSLPT